MNATKEQSRHIARQPFDMDKLVAFCGTNKFAKQLAVDMGDALEESDRARRNGDSDDTRFELMFWNGILFISDDTLFDMGIAADTVVDYSEADAYDDQLDATFSLCNYGRRKFIVVRYEFKEDKHALSAWWLTRDDHLGK